MNALQYHRHKFWIRAKKFLIALCEEEEGTKKKMVIGNIRVQ